LVFCKDSSINTFPTTVEAISTDLKIGTPPFISVANVLANLDRAPLWSIFPIKGIFKKDYDRIFSLIRFIYLLINYC
jgi:hypothetical protein